jgi:hypothetical protein
MMRRTIGAPVNRIAFGDPLADLDRALAELNRPAMIIGGIAVIATGVPRQTIDPRRDLPREG